MKCDVDDRVRLIALAADDPCPVGTIIASLNLPPYVTDAATVLLNGRLLASDGFAANLGARDRGLRIVRVLCGRLRGGMDTNGTRAVRHRVSACLSS